MEFPWPSLTAGFDAFMKLAQLNLEYIKALVWPLAILSLALIYRRPLTQLLGRVREASGWGVSVKAEADELAIDAQITRVIEETAARVARGTSNGEAQPAVGSEAKAEETIAPTGSGPSPDRPAPESPDPVSIPRSESAPTPHSDEATTLINFLKLDIAREQARALEGWGPLASGLSRDRLKSLTLASAASLVEGDDAQQRANKIEFAWLTITGLAYAIGTQLDLPRKQRTLTGVIWRLLDLGYLRAGTLHLAGRLERLFEIVQADENLPAAEVTSGFLVAAAELTEILKSVDRRLRSESVQFANGEPRASEAGDPNADTPNQEP